MSSSPASPAPVSTPAAAAAALPEARESRLAGIARSPWILAALLFGFACATFANSVQNSFAMDDFSLIQHNPLIRDLSEIGTIWRSDYWDPKLKSGLYRPLVISTYAISYHFWELDPVGWHVTNIVLFGLLTGMVLLLYRRVTNDTAVSTGAAFLFCALAIHCEVVANTAFGRPELLAGGLMLAALLLHMRRFDEDARRPGWLYAASLACLFVGLLAKESAGTLLGVMGLYDVLWRSDEREPLWKRIFTTFRDNFLRVYLGYLLAGAAYVGLRYWALGGAKTMPPEIALDNPLVSLEAPWSTLNALGVMFKYLGIMLYPAKLSYDYSYNEIPLFVHVSDLRWVGVVALSAAFAAFVVWAYRASRPTFFGVAFFLLTFAVVSNVFVLIGTILGERLAFLPSVGFCLAVVALLRHVTRRLPALSPRTAGALFALIVAVMVVGNAARAVVRNRDWLDAATLYLHDVEDTRSAKALNNAGALLLEQERYEEALALLQAAVAIKPLGYPVPFLSMGLIYSTLGDNEMAMEMYLTAIRNGDKNALTRNNLGFILVDEELDIRKGVLLLEEAVRMVPRHSEFRDSLGWGYYKAGRLKDAREQLEKSLELNPDGPTAPERRARLETVLAALASKE